MSQMPQTCGSCSHSYASPVQAMAGMVHCGNNVGGRRAGTGSANVFFFNPKNEACKLFAVRTAPLVFPVAAPQQAPAPAAKPPAKAPTRKVEDDLFPSDAFL